MISCKDPIMQGQDESTIPKSLQQRRPTIDLTDSEIISPKLKCQFSIPTVSWITGIDVNQRNQILLSAGESGHVFLYTEDGELITKESFGLPVWDCGLMSDDKIALLTEDTINFYTSDFFYIRKTKLKDFTSYHMVIDQDNFIILADILRNKVRIYNGFDGQPVSEFITSDTKHKKHLLCPENFFQTSVAINYKDEIIVADPTEPAMRVFANNGALLTTLPIKVPEVSNIIRPRAICSDNQERVWFAEESGKYLYVAPLYQNTENNHKPTGCLHLEAYGLNRPQALVCNRQGHLVVVDDQNQAAVIQI